MAQHDILSMLLSSSILIPGECEQICVGRKCRILRVPVRLIKGLRFLWVGLLVAILLIYTSLV
jgi:hypothetical protein